MAWNDDLAGWTDESEAESAMVTARAAGATQALRYPVETDKGGDVWCVGRDDYPEWLLVPDDTQDASDETDGLLPEVRGFRWRFVA